MKQMTSYFYVFSVLGLVVLFNGLLMPPAVCQNTTPFQLSSPSTTPPQADTLPAPPSPSTSAPLKSGVQKEGLPRNLFYQKLQQQTYHQYEEKSAAVKKVLTNTLTYLNTTESGLPDLQRISAYNAEAQLEWSTLQKTVSPRETSFHSYQLMQSAVTNLQQLTHYWVMANTVQGTYRGTQAAADADHAYIMAKKNKIESALKELQQREQLKQEVQAEITY